jgi:hypothetical protein
MADHLAKSDRIFKTAPRSGRSAFLIGFLKPLSDQIEVPLKSTLATGLSINSQQITGIESLKSTLPSGLCIKSRQIGEIESHNTLTQQS